jgi:hypothetical protein
MNRLIDLTSQENHPRTSRDKDGSLEITTKTTDALTFENIEIFERFIKTEDDLIVTCYDLIDLKVSIYFFSV